MPVYHAKFLEIFFSLLFRRAFSIPLHQDHGGVYKTYPMHFLKIKQSFHKTFTSALKETVRCLTLNRSIFLFHNDFPTNVK